MKMGLLGVAALLLGGCALAGLEGPERQQIAKQNLHDLPVLLSQLPGDALNDLGRFSRGYAGTGDSADDKLERLERHARNEAIWEGDWPYYP